MAVHDNTYSRVVSWLKIILPLLALALLSTLFLVARTIDPAQNLPFADVDVDELAAEQRIGAPNFSSVTQDGAAIALSATSARPDPDNPERLSGTGVNAGVDLPNGNRIDIVSDHLEIDNTAGTATLRDGVRIVTSDGFIIDTQVVEIALDATRFVSDTKTMVTAPIGYLTSNRFHLAKKDTSDGPYVLVFKGDVKLVYDPNE